MSYSIDAITADCYEGTTCLINKFNITDEEKLANVEAAITMAKAAALEKNPINGNFTFEHFCFIHRFLFEDLYEWAGKLREVEMSKKGTKFARSQDLASLCYACFERLQENNCFCGLKYSDFVENIVDFYCTLNLIHPFREGNGRTVRIFIAQLVRHCGYEINFSEINPDELMIATIHASNGIQQYLIDLFAAHIKIL
ncbi:MAG: cell filamentation protein Fic [Ruminococcaceae bacterium]|nr:cell filamentation protein Fic [Oscillospiraceae bacterium]